METTQVGNLIYNVDLLKAFAATLLIETVSLELLKGAVSEGNTYWVDGRGDNLGPFQLLQDWPAALKNENWQEHIENIQGANLENPICIMRKGSFVFDGMHRLTRAFLDGRPTIKVIYFDTIPESAIISTTL